MKKLIFICLFLVFYCQNLSAQIQVNFSDPLLTSLEEQYYLKTKDQELVLATLTKKLNEYIKLARLKGEGGGPDRESSIAFKNLFTIDGAIFNDLQEIPSDEGLYPVDGYINLARNYFAFEGLSFGINSPAVIKSILYNSINTRYDFTISVNKTVERFYNLEGKTISGNNNYDLDFVITMRLNEPEYAAIKRISRKGGKEASYYNRILGAQLGFGLTSASFSNSTYFDGLANKGSLNFTSKPEISLGLFYLSNKLLKGSSKKPLYLNLGLNLAFQNFTTSLKNHSTSPTFLSKGVILENSNQVVVDSLFSQAKNINVEEQYKTTNVKVGIGFSYRLFEKEGNMFLIGLQYLPSFNLLSKGSLTGTGDYVLFTNETNWSSTDDNGLQETTFDPQNILGERGNTQLEGSPDLKLNMVHNARLSATFFKDLVDNNPTYGIGVGAYLDFPLTIFWDSKTSIVEPLSASSAEGITSTFVEKAKIQSFGLHFSIYNKKISKSF